jgi:hypothetical protein
VVRGLTRNWFARDRGWIPYFQREPAPAVGGVQKIALCTVANKPLASPKIHSPLVEEAPRSPGAYFVALNIWMIHLLCAIPM